MTHTKDTRMTDRTLPHPWGLCNVCGAAAGLPDPQAPYVYRCPRCAARDALRDAAHTDLEALAAPIVGAWAAHWAAAGLTLEDLRGTVELLTGAWQDEKYRRAYVARALRLLRRQHRAPTFERAAPDRVALDVEALPMLTTYHPADPAGAYDCPHFLDEAGKAHTLHPGLDVLTLMQPDGSAVLIFTGMKGKTDLECARVPGYRVPARLLPHVQEALQGLP